jgi:hypothetical protein
MSNRKTDMTNQIASTILRQLGGNKFLAMTGAKYLVAGDNFLQFTLPNRKINSVVVRLDGDDTYTMLFNKKTNMGIDIKPIASATGVYADQLQNVFTDKTGLYTSL